MWDTSAVPTNNHACTPLFSRVLRVNSSFLSRFHSSSLSYEQSRTVPFFLPLPLFGSFFLSRKSLWNFKKGKNTLREGEKKIEGRGIRRRETQLVDNRLFRHPQPLCRHSLWPSSTSSPLTSPRTTASHTLSTAASAASSMSQPRYYYLGLIYLHFYIAS